MEFSAYAIAVPALLALACKIGIYAYAQRSPVHNRQTRLYLFFLFALSIQNVAEVLGFYNLITYDLIPSAQATVYYAASIAALAILLHLAMAFGLGEAGRAPRTVLRAVYAYAAGLETLLLLTPWLISGYERFPYGGVTRVPGPLFPLFELYAVGIFCAAVALFAHGARHRETRMQRVKNLFMLLAIVPMALLVMAVIALLHYGIQWISTPITLPIAITIFLVITAYATYQHRLFDIQLYIPWSRVRRRKTAFYNRIRAMIAEFADLGSVKSAIERLADTLHCPVALLGETKPVLAAAGGAPQMADFPRATLKGVDRIVVAHEIADAMPELHALMRRHAVAAVVPFYPHSRGAASWLLLGERFSEQVYSKRDFELVEQLFDRLAELFLDKLVLMRTQLQHAWRELRASEQRLHEQQRRQAALERENRELREQNTRLLDSSITAIGATVLGPAAGSLPRPESPPERTPDKTLDEYVAEFEAGIIAQALERCAGNKSKAARLLGLRPNTLHYKLERYGLSGDKKD
jgi:transposase-like protein